MSPVLTAEAVTKHPQGGHPVRDVDLELVPGAVTAVVGAPGSGRTTLLRCLSGTYRPDAGAVLLRDAEHTLDLAHLDVRTLAWVRRHHLAVHDVALAAPPRRVTRAAVARAAHVDEGSAARVLEDLGLAEACDVPLGRLGAAQRRLASLAAALASPAPVVLLDDVDAAPPGPVRAHLARLTGGGAAVVVTLTHRSPLQAAADAVVHLDEGNPRWT